MHIINERTILVDLPKGIWYEESRERYRVKLHKNNVTYMAGYFTCLNAALAAHAALVRKLERIPKIAKGKRPPKILFGGSMQDLIFSAIQEANPNSTVKG